MSRARSTTPAFRLPANAPFLRLEGELFTVPAEHGVVRNLTRSSGVAERYPAWSPDGKWIAYFSDRSGEYELTLCNPDAPASEEKLTCSWTRVPISSAVVPRQ
jgi:tricorn protease